MWGTRPALNTSSSFWITTGRTPECARARLAADILHERLGREPGIGGAGVTFRVDLIGVSALHATAHASDAGGHPKAQRDNSDDVRVRVAMRTADRAACETMLWEVESLLCCGPAGGGGYRGQITPSVVTHSALLERDRVKPRVELLVA